MNDESHNCTICAKEFNISELSNIVLGIHNTKFKVCQSCLDSDPEDDYRQVRKIIGNYHNNNIVKYCYNEVLDILKQRS